MSTRDKHKILLIEPSEIVSAGITAIISRSPEFTITQAVSSPGYCNTQSTEADIIIINPAVIDYNERLDIRSYFNKENLTIVALTHSNYEESVLQQYDGCIGIYDSAQRIIQKLKTAQEEATQSPKSNLNELSARERDILRAVAQGKTNKEIADEFNISIYTVISHRRNISQKLGINSISGLTVYAIMNKLVDMSDFG